MMAGPLKSAPVDPAVGRVLGTVSVEVSWMWIMDLGRPRARLATSKKKELYSTNSTMDIPLMRDGFDPITKHTEEPNYEGL